MKKLLLALLLFALVGCSNEKTVEPDTPTNAAMLMKHRIDIQNYEAFQRLFYEEAKDTISKEEFKELQQFTTAGSEHREHMLLTFTNGEMLLVEFAAKIDEDENYEIVNLKRVPEEVKAFFNSK